MNGIFLVLVYDTVLAFYTTSTTPHNRLIPLTADIYLQQTKYALPTKQPLLRYR
jgi:hypothetical protein